MPLQPDLDRTCARLAAPARQAVRGDARRIVIVGARGWIGRTTLALLHEALGPQAFAERVICFGSKAGHVDIGTLTSPQRPLAELATLEQRPTLLFHLAFLTKDKVADMDAADYALANRALSQTVLDGLDRIGVDRLFVASSGAASFADDAAAAPDLRLYGGLKRDDETLFAAWADADPTVRRAAIGRIFSVSGPWINKHETYALASFILDALAGRPIEVRAPMPVLRSYVAVRELVSVVLSMLLADTGAGTTHFSTGGDSLELGDAAAMVAQEIGGRVLRRPITQPLENRYVGDAAGWNTLLRDHAIHHLPLSRQIAETAAYLARQADMAPQPAS